MTSTLRRPIFVMTAIVIGSMWFAAAAQAQMVCGTRDSVVARLSEDYGETRRGGGLADPLAIFEIWASDETGTWTILETTPDGFTCIMAVGTDWQSDAVTTLITGDGA